MERKIKEKCLYKETFLGMIKWEPIYVIRVIEKLVCKHTEVDGKAMEARSGIVEFFSWDIVGFCHEKEIAVELVEANDREISDACYNYAIVEKMRPGIYPKIEKCWIFQYDKDTDKYIQIDELNEPVYSLVNV